MVDAAGTKTMTVLLGLILVSLLFTVARLSRREVSAGPALAADATTHGGRPTVRQARPPVQPQAPAVVLSEAPRETHLVNRALREVEMIERTELAAPLPRRAPDTSPPPERIGPDLLGAP